ncbi:MAG: ABC transporter permease [Clostridia bacterium]
MVKKVSAWIYILIVLAFIYLPIAFIIVYSFTTSKVIGSWSGFSFDLYRQIFVGAESAKILGALKNTLVLGISASILATILGTSGAIGIHNLTKKAQKAFSTINQVPILNADIVTGISLLLLFVMFGINRGFVTLLICHVAFCTPYVVLSVLPRLRQMDNSVYEAALDLGATPMRALWKIVIPEIMPGVISGFLLAFTLSIDDFVITVFNNGSFQTLSTFIYADARKGGLTPSLRALSTLIFVFVLALLLIVNIRSRRAEKHAVKLK